MSSYLTLSPLPRSLAAARRFAFCGTFLGVAPTRRYLASCPTKLGLSSRVRMHTSDHVNLSNLGKVRPVPDRRNYTDGLGADADEDSGKGFCTTSSRMYSKPSSTATVSQMYCSSYQPMKNCKIKPVMTTEIKATV